MKEILEETVVEKVTYRRPEVNITCDLTTEFVQARCIWSAMFQWIEKEREKW